MVFALSFCTPVLLELFLCMHPQIFAIVSQLLRRLFRCSLVYIIFVVQLQCELGFNSGLL